MKVNFDNKSRRLLDHNHIKCAEDPFEIGPFFDEGSKCFYFPNGMYHSTNVRWIAIKMDDDSFHCHEKLHLVGKCVAINPEVDISY